MGKFRKDSKNKEIPAVSTASLPDIIFMLLFFFMISTTMKEVTYKVDIKIPEATEITKVEKKSLCRFIYVGTPKREYQSKMGSETCIQLDDAFAEVSMIEDFVNRERTSMKEEEQGLLTMSMKIDKGTKMGVVTDVKQALRRAKALKINYVATEKVQNNY